MHTRASIRFIAYLVFFMLTAAASSAHATKLYNDEDRNPLAEAAMDASNGAGRVIASTLTPLTTRSNDSSFYNSQGRVNLLGVTDTSEHGWPLISQATLETLASYGVNYTHIRLGPFTDEEGSEQFLAYAYSDGGKVDLNSWNFAFWQQVRSILSKAESLGIYVEVDLIDAWVLERPHISPWTHTNNVNGVNEGHCDILTRAPGPVQEKFLRKAVAETGEFPNVIYQIGNETFDCRGVITSQYEFGVADIVRDELEVQGFGNRLIGTNSHKKSIECSRKIDYVIRHSDTVPSLICGKPLQVNETGYDTAFLFKELHEAAVSTGVYWHLWRGNLSSDELNSALDYIQSVQASR
jgi:hypothetical protein